MNLEERARHASQGIHRSVEVMQMTTPVDELRPGSVERLERYRGRKDRNRKIGAAVLATAITVGIAIATWSVFLGGTDMVPSNTPITAGNVGDLGLAWTGDLGGQAPAPAVSGGVVVDATAGGRVTAFAAGCGVDGSMCAPLWTAQVAPISSTIDRLDPAITWWPDAPGPPNGAVAVGTVAAEDGFAYTLSLDGTLSAFHLNCRSDGAECAPAWTTTLPPFAHGYESLPIVADGMVFVQGLTGRSTGVFAFDAHCGPAGPDCTPGWHAAEPDLIRVQDGVAYVLDQITGRVTALQDQTGVEIWHTGANDCCGNFAVPTRFGDSVYVNFGSTLKVYPAACEGRCEPTWWAAIPSAYDNGVIVAGGAVILTTAEDGDHGGLIAFPVDCATSGHECTSSHRSTLSQEVTSTPPEASLDGRVVLVQSPRRPDAYAFETACLARQDDCKPVWGAVASRPWQGVPEGDLFFVPDADEAVTAYAAACTDACEPLWTSDAVPLNRPTIADGTAYVTSADGTLSAYALGAASTSGQTSTSGGAPLFYGILALVAIAIVAALAIRRRRTG